MKIKYIGLVAIFAGLMSCEDVVLETQNGSGEMTYSELNTSTVDFSNYIAVGASFTAGYTDGALFVAGQEDSFPSILAQKMDANGGTFSQPLVDDNIGGLVLGTMVIAEPRLYFNGAGPVRLAGTPTTQATTPAAGSHHNLGVPGVKSTHLLFDGLGNAENLATETANPYFVRIASAPNATILGDAVASSPTFFTLSEIGGNDVLGYATSGGDGTNPITPPEGAPGIGFNQTFEYIVDMLTAGGAKGVVANVPYVSSLPHFTAVPYNPVPLEAANAEAVNQGFAPYNGGIQQALAALKDTGLFTEAEAARRTISFAEGQNAVVIVDEDLTDLGAINPAFAGLPKYRQATSEDLLLLPSSSFIGSLVGDDPQLINGVTVPLEDKWVLTPEEQEALKSATDAYNIKISEVAAAKGLALVDLNGILQEAATTGIVFDNYTMTTDLVFGGLVSLDGIHLTARGYALMANKFLEAIDESYGTNFVESNTMARAGEYPTNYSPILP